MIQTFPTINTPLPTGQISSKIAHRCDDANCETTVFEVKNGMMILERKHHGEQHTTIVSIAELYQLYIATGNSLAALDFFGGVGQ